MSSLWRRRLHGRPPKRRHMHCIARAAAASDPRSPRGTAPASNCGLSACHHLAMVRITCSSRMAAVG